MKSTSKTILFFGTEDFSLTSLEKLIEAGFTIGAVITKPDSQKGRGRKVTPPSVKTLALKHGIDVWQPNKLSEITEQIARFDKPIGVLVSFGKIVPQSIINLFTPGIINVHPSLLPLYRGPSPIESAIKNGDPSTGISIMKLDAKMDAGPVYKQVVFPLNGSETKPALYNTLAELGAKELVSSLPNIIDGSLHPTAQKDEAAVYCPLLSKDSTEIDPTQHTAIEIERIIRAHLGYPKTRLPFYNETPIITKAHVSESANEYTIRSSDSFLQVDELIAKSGKTIAAQDYLRGLRL
jgi:methionyl-tRNA formyltransferase